MKRILVIDTSMLCCWLRIPGKETAGPTDDLWDFPKIDELLSTEQELGSTFVLPLATLIETGNHIAQSASRRYECASGLAAYLSAAANAESPWTAFTEQADMWSNEGLRKLSTEWPNLAAQKISIGDATIREVADYYARVGYDVEILTGDAGLKAFQPAKPVQTPRRRS